MIDKVSEGKVKGRVKGLVESIKQRQFLSLGAQSVEGQGDAERMISTIRRRGFSNLTEHLVSNF